MTDATEPRGCPTPGACAALDELTAARAARAAHAAQAATIRRLEDDLAGTAKQLRAALDRENRLRAALRLIGAFGPLEPGAMRAVMGALNDE